MKKSYILATLLTVATCALAACGGSDPAAQSPDSSATAVASAPPPDMPPEPPASAAVNPPAADTSKPADKPPASPDIIETAKAAGNFTMFLGAVEAAGLTDTLKGPGPFTVFAPNDDAFKKIPKATADKLAKDKDAMARILKFHVVPGKLLAADVIKLKDSDTAAGVKVTFKVKGADVSIDKAKIIKTDITASNGVIHVIDTVIMPPPAKK